MAMGISVARARGSVRFSLGIYNTAAEVEYLLEKLPGVISRLRADAPVTERKHNKAPAAVKA